VILVKLGGSVITDKSRLRTFRRSTTQRLARELAGKREAMVLVHGAGSFGHIEAKKHRLHQGMRSNAQLKSVASVQRDVRELNLKVIETLIDCGIRAVSVPPAASASFENGQVRAFSKQVFGRFLDLGLAPVTFGDVVPDAAMGFSICSGDLMMMALARAFKPRLAVFCADVDGVYDRDPKRTRGAELLPVLDRQMARGLRQTIAVNADVTGGMHGKLERMLAIARHCEKCMIVNGNVPGRLEGALAGRRVPSTVVVPG